MNRNLYRLVQNTLGLWVAVPEVARGQHKGGGQARRARRASVVSSLVTGMVFLSLAGASTPLFAEGSLPVAFEQASFASNGYLADYKVDGNTGTVSQVGNRAIVNFKEFNVGVGNKVIYQQVKDLNGHALVDGATFNNLTRIADGNPSVIAGTIQAATGQHVNLMLINQNGILFTPTAQVDTNSLTVSSLNLTDKALQDYIKGNIVPVSNVDANRDPLAQFQGSTGFVKVLDGARISASNGGSVLMIAPSVTNRGLIQLSGGGQTILAAGNKVYLIANQKDDGTFADDGLRGFFVEVDNDLATKEYDTINTGIPSAITLDGKSYEVADGYDKLGNATNLGSITSEQGNITMVGLAVNQMGRVTATSSLSLNGSIYLHARDTAKNVDSIQTKDTSLIAATRAGKLTVGENSTTKVVLETADELEAAGLAKHLLDANGQLVRDANGKLVVTNADTSTAIAAQQFVPSKVELVGRDVDIQSKALIEAHNGQVNIYALENPALEMSLFSATSSTYQNNAFALNYEGLSTKPKQDAHIYMSDSAKIDVSGVDTEKSVADNYLSIKLLSDELKDSPINRDLLRGQTVWVDLVKGAPLIANIGAYQASMKKGLSEIAAAAGSVNFNSKGEVVVDQGAAFDVSGGKVVYKDANLNITQLIDSNGKVYNMDAAPADVKYTGIVGRSIYDHGRWGVTETLDAGNLSFVKGYTVGADAGAVNVQGVSSYFGGVVDGTTTVGEKQASSGAQPKGASLSFANTALDVNQTTLSGLNQNVIIGSAAAKLKDGFKAGDNLSAEQSQTLMLDTALFGGHGVNNLSVKSVGDIAVDKAINMSPKGSLSLTGHNVNINADIKAQSGTVSLFSGVNEAIKTEEDNSTTFIDSSVSKIKIGDGIKISTAGAWFNESTETDLKTPKNIDAGSVTLNSGSHSEIVLGESSVMDVRGGGYVAAGNKVAVGNGGNVTLAATKISTSETLQSHLKGEALGKGGTLSVSAAKVDISDAVNVNLPSPDATGALPEVPYFAVRVFGQADAKTVSINSTKNNLTSSDLPESTSLYLDKDFFQQGFSQYNVTGQAGVTVSDGAQINVQSKSYQLAPSSFIQTTGADMADVASVVVLPDQTRKPASISLTSSSIKPLGGLPADTIFGVVKIGTGSRLQVDPLGTILLSSNNAIEVDGSLVAKSGTINLKNKVDNLNDLGNSIDTTARVHLGANSTLDASGVAKVYTNTRGLNTGDVLAGGAVNIDSTTYLSADKGAVIDVSGTSPTKLDVLSTDGQSIGRLVASDAGTVNITAAGVVTQEIEFKAQSGSASNLGGTISIIAGAGPTDAPGTRIIKVGQGDAFAASAMAESQKSQVVTDVNKLVESGFDFIKLTADQNIQLSGDMNAGKTATGTMQTLQFVTPSIISDGGNAKFYANIIRLDNSSSQISPETPASGDGSLSLNGNMIEFVASDTFSGLKTLNLNSATELRLTGKQSDTTLYATGTLSTVADINVKAAVVAPSSLSDFTINTTGNVNFEANGNAMQPYSAFGKLTVNAQNINQEGYIVAPFGSVVLNATDTLTLADNSVTSVSANGMLLPYGKTRNGRDFYIGLSGNEVTATNAILALDQKTLSLKGKSVDLKSNAKVDISGGGDLQAWEFTAGPGGSTDKLAQPGVYAIVPSYQGVAAPSDRQTDSTPAVLGQRIYLSGGNGLAAGYYILMPAHYALLPGAFSVKVTGSVADLIPTNNYTKPDGTAVVAGFLASSSQTSSEPINGRWSGFEVLSNAQVLGTGVRDGAGYTLTNASNFFSGNANSALPTDAGLLQIDADNKLSLDGSIKSAAANGGRNGGLDIASISNIAVVDGTPAAADEIVLDVTKLNSLKLGSLLLGGTRTKNTTTNPDGTVTTTTAINVKSNQVRVDGQSSNPLQAEEVMLVAKDTVALQNATKIVASGEAGTATTYQLSSDGALLRAGASDASIERASPLRVTGTLLGDSTTQVVSSNSIILDATKDNLFNGKITFEKNGKTVAGNLTSGSSSISIGDAVPEGISGLVLNQAKLDTLGNLNTLRLRSYNAFDFYGNSTLGTKSSASVYTLQNLSLEGSGFSGKTNGVVNFNASNLTIKNPDGGIAATDATGAGQINLAADKLMLGVGSKQIAGFTQTNINATEVIGQGIGALTVDGNATVTTARMSGEAKANQIINASGNLDIKQFASSSVLTAATALGANWKLSGNTVSLDAAIETHGGDVSLQASNGDVTLGQHANIDVSGKVIGFFDQPSVARAGNVTLKSDAANVAANSGAVINVSAADGGDAGKLTVSAAKGQAEIAKASIRGSNKADSTGQQGKGASFVLDVDTLSSVADGGANLDVINKTIEAAGFSELRDIRVRNGDVSLTLPSTGNIAAHNVKVEVDNGALTVANTINSSGAKGGTINLSAKGDITLTSSANLIANATELGEKGGNVNVSTSEGQLDLQGGVINVANAIGQNSGEVLLRSPRTSSGIAVTSFSTSVEGAGSVVLEGVKTYSGVQVLTATTDGKVSDGITSTANKTGLSVKTIVTDNSTFMSNKASILGSLGSVVQNLGAVFHLRGGAQVESDGDLVVKDDVNLYNSARTGGEPGALTLRATGNLKVNGSISDGFTSTTPHTDTYTTPTASATRLASNDSWSYRFIAGADKSATGVMSVNGDGTGNFTLAANKVIRTGTGDIDIATGGSFNMLGSSTSTANTTSSIYTAGKLSDNQTNLKVATGKDSTTSVTQYYGANGGNITLDVMGSLNGAISNQLYSNWLQRTSATTADINGASWGVNYSNFKQGIATFGGGDIQVNALGDVKDLSLSTVTTRNGKTGKTYGGGDITVNAQGNIGGGTYYAEQGDLSLNAQGSIGDGLVNSKNIALNPIITLGNSKAVIYAKNDVTIQGVLNPFMLPIANGAGNGYFTTYGPDSAVNVTSLQGDVTFNNDVKASGFFMNGTTSIFGGNNSEANLSWAGTLEAVALQGNVNVNDPINLISQSDGQLQLLAGNNVNFINALTMDDREISSIPASINPTSEIGDLQVSTSIRSNALLHESDMQPVRVYAKNGDIKMPAIGNVLTLPKSVRLIAGNDIINPVVDAQNMRVSDVTYLKAGRDIIYKSVSDSAATGGVTLGGPGLLDLEAGRNVDLGPSKGIQTQGNQLNAELAEAGASVRVTTGVPNGVDYVGALDRLIAQLQSAVTNGTSVSESTLWAANWLLKLGADPTDSKADDKLRAANTPQSLLAAVNKLRTESNVVIEEQVRAMFYQGLRDTGIAHNSLSKTYDRAYDVIELLFPSINVKNADGSSVNYAGSLLMPLSRIKTTDGGDIEFMVPGGETLVGYADTPAASAYALADPKALGIVAVDSGVVHGFSVDDITVNQSRILTTGNKGEASNIWLWSSEGDIDAGKGARTAVTIPPPIITIKNGVVAVVQSNVATGSGIGALGDSPVGNHPTTGAGEVALLAPKGTVNAGDAGIRAGNIVIAAQTVIGADNITASGSSSGVPVSDVGAFAGALSGNSGVGGDAAKSVTDSVADSAKNQVANNFTKPTSPSLINVEVLSIGD